MFKPGDRVKIKSLDDTGTVIVSNEQVSTVTVDTPSKLIPITARDMPGIQDYELPAGQTAKYWTWTSDLELIGLSEPEPDWADIWDKGST